MNIIDGDGNNNTLVGTAGDDLINGYDGDDTINAGDGNDWIDGGSGDDTIDAGDGDDTVIYDANDTSVTGGAGNDVLVFSNGDVYSFDTSLLAGMGFEFAGDRYTDGTDDVIDILDANFLYLEERRYHADGTYTRTVFDALNVETWSEWIRVYDASGVLVSENFVQDGTGGGGGSNTAPEDYASVTEDLVLIVTGNLFDDDLVNNPTGIYELTEIAGVVIPTGTVQPGAPVIISGTFGTLHIWSDGEYEYYLNNSQVQSLSTDDIVPDSFAYEFTEDGQTLNTDFIVEIVGTNDAPVATNNTAYVQKDIVLSDTGNVITDDDGSGVDSDIDNLQLGITEVNGNALNPGGATLIAGLYGDLLIDGNTGDYTYTLATSGPGFITVQALDFGETLIDAFTYTLSDGSEFVLANLDITVEGSSVSVQAFGDVNTTTEDEVTPVTGSVLANDAGIGLFVSNVNSASVASSGDTIVVGAYGTLTIDATGAYSYVVDPASAPAQALKDGESLTDVFTYTAENGFNSENANLSISITGVNDAAVVSGDDTAQVTEDLGNPPTDLGVISVFDADTGESTFQAGDYVGVYGTVALTGAGAYTYTLDNSSLLVQSLGEGIIATDTVAIQTFDGTTHNIVVDITGVNDAATFSGDDQGSVTEEDDPLTLIDSGILIVSDVDTGEAVFNASTQPGAYGSFTIDAAGNWTYSADNTQTAIQELGGSSTLTETFTVSSIDNTTHNITVTINGTNDAAVIGGTDTGSVTEEDDPTTLTATGLLTITDIDLNEAIFSANTIAGAYGSLTIDTAGNWSYTADNTQSAIQSLGLGSSLVDTITIQAIDGTTHDIAITINGTNDAAVIAGDDQGSVTEDATTPTITDSGTLTITDVDLNEAVFVADNLSGALGGLSIDTAGNWFYAAFTNQQAIQELGIGDTLTESFTVHSVDGTEHTIDVVINGSNDAAIIGGVDTGSVTEDGGALQVTTGTLIITDVDTGQASFADGPVSGTYGALVLDTAGNWTYTLNNAHAAVQALPAGATIQDIVTVTSFDGTTHDITITITGTNDAAIITGDNQGAVVEDDDLVTLSDTGVLAVTDIDTGEATFTAETINGTLGSLTINATGTWSFSTDNTQTVIQQLGTGDTLSETFTVSTLDGTTQSIDIIITGTNDAPVAGVDAGGLVLGTTGVVLLVADLLSNDTDIEGDTLSLTEIDGIAIVPNGLVVVRDGTVVMSSDGSSLTFIANNGYAGPTSFNYTVSDGQDTGQGTVTFEIEVTAANDALVISEDTSGDLTVLANDGVEIDKITDFNIITQPDHGNIVINPDNSVTYTPDANYNGSDQFTYEFTGMSSGLAFEFYDRAPFGNTVNNIQNLNVTATGIATDFDVKSKAIEFSGSEETYSFKFTGFIYVETAGTYDFTTTSDDGSRLSVNNIDVVLNDGLHSAQLRSGSITLSAGYHQIEILFFERNQDDVLAVTVSGPDTGNVIMDLFASDMVGHNLRTETATADITVVPVNDAAIIAGVDTASVSEDEASPNLLASGALTITDIDAPGQEAFAPETINTDFGSLTIQANGNWSYSALNANPAIQGLLTGQSLVETITVNSVDGTSHDITITINGLNDATIAVDESPLIVSPGTTFNFDVLANDIDLDNVTLSVTGVFDPAAPDTLIAFNAQNQVMLSSGTVVTLMPDGTLDVTLGNQADDSESFDYQLSSSDGGTDRATVTLQIDTDGDGVANDTDIDDDNDGILDINEVAQSTGSDSGVDGALTSSSVSFGVSSANLSDQDGDHILTSVTIDGRTFTDFVLPDAYNYNFTASVNLTYQENGTTAASFVGNPNWDADILQAFQSTDLNDYQESNSSFNAGDYYELGYTTPLFVTAGTFIGVTERGGNNPVEIQAYNDQGNPLGVKILVSGSNYLDTGARQNSSQNAEMAIYNLDDLAPVGSSISSIRVFIPANSGGPDGKVFVFGDGVAFGGGNRLDIDADNDGITDNVEAQATGSYVAPSGVDIDGDGLDDAYDADTASTDATLSVGLIPVDTDGDGFADYVDFDSDNDGQSDAQERGDGGPTSVTATLDTDGDGLVDIFEGSNVNDGFDVNDDNILPNGDYNLGGVPNLLPDGSNANADIDLSFRDVNQAPTISNLDITVGTVSEDASQTALGNLFTLGGVSDVEGDALSIATIEGSPITFGQPIHLSEGGILIVQANGDFTYDPNGAFENLGLGNSAIDTFDYTISDGNGGTDTATVTVTINGANDAAIIGGLVSTAVREDDSTPNLTKSGQLTITDTDAGEDAFIAETVSGTYGSLTIDTAGAWVYTADNSQPDIQALHLGTSVVDTLIISSLDGTQQTITIRIRGRNDAPVATDNTASVTEDTAISQTGNVLSDDDGQGVDTDIDIGNILVVTEVAGTSVPGTGQVSISGQFGTLLIGADGSYTYTLDNTSPVVQNLTDGTTLSDSFTYEITDGTVSASANLTITINGTTDAAIVVTGDGTANTLQGADGNDTLNGGAGHDILDGGEGADALIGGTGHDTASYKSSSTGVTVNLSDTSQNTGAAAGDTYSSIERIEGSNFNDVLIGTDGTDYLIGGDGDDVLEGGLGNDAFSGGRGADVFNGGDGRDNVSYALADAAVTADLTNAANNTGEAAGDSYISIEMLQGSQYDDTLTGDTSDNWLYGFNGNDTISAGSGADILFGGGGSDTLSGGSGADIFYFINGETGTDIITDFENNIDVLNLKFRGFADAQDVLNSASSSGSDTVIDFGNGNSLVLQNFTFSNFDQTDFIV